MTPEKSDAIELHSLRIALDREAEVPLGVQLAWALRARVRDGELPPGARLPGLRELAEGLGVNANTVRAVYQRLEREGVLSSQQGSGTFVAAVPHPPSAIAAIAADAAREAQRSGIDPREVAAALYVAPDPPARADSEEVERRRRLRAQIAALEQALSEMEVDNPGLLRPPRAHRAPKGPRLLDSAELEQVKAHLARRIAALQGAIDARAAEEAAPDPEQAARERAAKARKARARATTRPATSSP